MRNIVAYIRLFFFGLSIIILTPILVVVSMTKVLSPWYNRFYFKVVCFFLGIKIRIKRGKLAKMKNLLLVCNHNSYLDIFAIGSLLKINFVSKDDVKKWPVFGFLSRLGNTIYISRNKMRAGQEINVLEVELKKRKLPVLIFPEGTSTDGNQMLPFKSSLFAMFENHIGQKRENQIYIQPVSIAYVYRGRQRMNDEERKTFAWYLKDQSFIEHFLNVVKYTPFTMEVILHDPIDISHGFKDRKELALYCHDIVEAGFNELLNRNK